MLERDKNGNPEGLVLGFTGGSVIKNLPADAGQVGSSLESGRSPGVENGNPPRYSCLENPWTEEPGGLQKRVRHV